MLLLFDESPECVYVPLKQFLWLNELLELFMFDASLSRLFLQLLIHHFHGLDHVLERFLHDFTATDLLSLPHDLVNEHIRLDVFGYALHTYLTQVMQWIMGVAKGLLHLIIVVNVELKPARLLQIHFHCVVLELCRVQVISHNVPSR